MSVPSFSYVAAENKDDFLMTKDGTRAMAKRITEAWRREGRDVRCRIVQVRDENQRVVCYEVRSDLRDGLPRRRIAAA